MRTASAQASASFPPEPVSAREARRFLVSFLEGHERPELADAAVLALSEVVTNAVLHAHTPFEVTALLQPDRTLRVEVSDRNPQLPVQRDYPQQATTGRGMDLVAALTAECGVVGRGAAGKTVWFVVHPAPDGGGEDGEAPLAGWDIDLLEGAGSAADGRSVLLLGLPPTLWLAAREHHDAVLRELALFGAEHPQESPTQERLALADRARAWVSARVVAELDRLTPSDLHRALPAGHPSLLPETPVALDLEVAVTDDDGGGAAFGALQDVLDVAERLAVAGRLLARPGLPEIVAVRDWACEQVVAQLSGVLPSPWPGTGLERFTVEVHDREPPERPQWDAGMVSDAERGAVAADDANRIVAVSRPLAAALGWKVEDLVGRRVVVLIPPEMREAHVAGFTRHLATGEAHALGVPLRLPVLRADGSRISCDFLLEQAPASGGRPVYVAWIDPVDEPLASEPAPATPTR